MATQKERKKTVGVKAKKSKSEAKRKATNLRVDKGRVKRGEKSAAEGNKAGRQAGIKQSDKARANIKKAKDVSKKASQAQKKRRKK